MQVKERGATDVGLVLEYSDTDGTFPSTHKVFLFVLVLEHLCVLTSLMENLGLGTGCEKENLDA